MPGNTFFYRLGRITGVQFRKAKWMWQSVAGSEADAIHAEQRVGRDMATVVLEEISRDLDQTTQALLDDVGGKLTAVVRNRLHRFQVTAVNPDQPTAFALPGGFIFVARSLVHLCDRDRDEVAFVLAHEMAHVIRRHAIDRLLQQKVVSALALASTGPRSTRVVDSPGRLRGVGARLFARPRIRGGRTGPAAHASSRLRLGRSVPSASTVGDTRGNGWPSQPRLVSLDASLARRSCQSPSARGWPNPLATRAMIGAQSIITGPRSSRREAHHGPMQTLRAFSEEVSGVATLAGNGTA